jgi:IclR family transcriptional regulator, acetate operon repressor
LAEHEHLLGRVSHPNTPPHPSQVADFATAGLRAHYLVEDLFPVGQDEAVAAILTRTGTEARAPGAVSISTLVLEPWDRPLADLATRVRASAREIADSLGALPMPQ